MISLDSHPFSTFTPNDCSVSFPSSSLFFGALGVLLVFFTLAPGSAQGQEFGRIEETKSTVAYFYFAEPGDATIQVAVWGSVGKTGIYEVPVETELDRLLTMAGGAPLTARSENQKREITIRLYREVDGKRRAIYEAPIEEMIANPDAYPDIQDQDVMIVETITDQRFTFQTVLSLVSTLASLTLLGLRLFGRRR